MKPALRILTTLLMVGPAAAQEYVTVPAGTALSDTDFYRAVACAAQPDKSCQKLLVRWSDEAASDLTLRIVSSDPRYPNDLQAGISAALDHAVTEINAAGTVVEMRRARATEAPDIAIHLLNEAEGDTVASAPDPELSGITLPAAYVHVWWGADARVTRAVILFASSLRAHEIRSVVLEEVLQATGLLTDIDSAYYNTRSLFAENGPNAIDRLQGQDLMALQRHYPAR